MRDRTSHHGIVRWTRGFAALLVLQAGLTMVLALGLLPPIGQVGRQAVLTPVYALTRGGSLIFAACLLLSAVALWRLQRWGLIVLAAAVLVFSVPLGVARLGFLLSDDSLQSAESIFFALGPVCVPYTLLALILYAFWRGLGEIR